MKPKPYQIDYAKEALQVLRKYMIVFLTAQERVGKTIPALLMCEEAKLQNILVITKLKALKDWDKTIKAMELSKSYDTINYHKAYTKIGNKYDLIVLDESHNYISAFPKVGKIWSEVSTLCAGLPMIYMTATPHAEGYHLLYHQLKLSYWNPWKNFKTSMDWFAKYGVFQTVWISGQERPVYTKSLEIAKEDVEHLFVTKTRREAGFKHEPKDELCYVELKKSTKEVYNIITKERAITLNGWDLVCDTPSKLKSSLHMLEGGVMIVTTPEKVFMCRKCKSRKVESKDQETLKYKCVCENPKASTYKHKVRLKKNYIQLGNTEKIDYIKNRFGDSKDIVIMYNYIAEGEKLRFHFKQAEILQATSYAEGVDLMQYDTLIIYSQDFSTARHSQRRARQANIHRETPMTIMYLVVSKGISEDVYNSVSIKKVNYVDSAYKPQYL